MFIFFSICCCFYFVVVVFKARCQLSHEEKTRIHRKTDTHTEREEDARRVVSNVNCDAARSRDAHSCSDRTTLASVEPATRDANVIAGEQPTMTATQPNVRAVDETKRRRRRRHDRLDNTTDTNTHAAKANVKATEPATEHANGSCASTETERRCRCCCRASCCLV